MGRYPRTARDAAIKCVRCNAPVTRTVEDRYVCVECGRSPIVPRVTGEEGTVHGD